MVKFGIYTRLFAHDIADALLRCDIPIGVLNNSYDGSAEVRLIGKKFVLKVLFDKCGSTTVKDWNGTFHFHFNPGISLYGPGTNFVDDKLMRKIREYYYDRCF